MPSLPSSRVLANPRTLTVRRAAVANPRAALANQRGADGGVVAFDPLSLTSLVALYDPDTFGKGTPDTSGNGRDALFQGTVWPVWSPFNVGDKPNSLYFDGVDRGSNAANSAANCGATGTGVTGAFCLEIGLRRKRTGVTEILAGRWGLTVGSDNYLAYVDAAGKFNGIGDTGPGHIVGVATLGTGTPYVVCVDCDGTTLRTFVNGIADGSVACTGPSAPDGITPLMLGQYVNTGGNGFPFNGNIQWVRLSNVSRHTANYVPSIPANTDANTLVLIKNGSVIAAPDATAISSLGDLSGQGNHLYQATGAAQPVWKAAIRNGHSVLRFAGAQNLDTSAVTYAQPNSVYSTGNVTDATAARSFVDGVGTTSALSAAITSGLATINAGSAVASSDIRAAWHLRGIFDGASSSVRVDGSAAVTGNAGANSLTTAIRLGKDQAGAANFLGDMGLTAVQNAHASPSEVASMMAYLKARYQTP